MEFHSFASVTVVESQKVVAGVLQVLLDSITTSRPSQYHIMPLRSHAFDRDSLLFLIPSILLPYSIPRALDEIDALSHVFLCVCERNVDQEVINHKNKGAYNWRSLNEVSP